ncbi:hypothetical protein VNI00_000887 [Paramarasmius palmivorus]|uniref:T6SS Phospholipase effector Tle1-like catalytic domain-containing protein n=1 Tax=Paramarasmius palmivorus TaxID=297713 RepID=A0AAW0E568_9AGAR
MDNPSLPGKFDSTDVEDAEDRVNHDQMKPVRRPQRHCSCIHDALPHTYGSRRSRNLVVCIDGTANQFSDKNTNVVELYSRLEKDEALQVTFYNSGIGTYARSSWKSLAYYRQVIGHKIDLAIAWRFENILLSAYRWISEQYETGDRIFLFGFSRGAYQVRVLSAMIEKVGLIHRGNEAQIPFAYDLYQKTTDSNNPPPVTEEKMKKRHKEMGTTKAEGPVKSSEQSVSSGSVHPGTEATGEESFKSQHQSKHHSGGGDADAASFKRTFCRDHVKVHFVGVWDTVSSVGFARNKDLPLTTEGMKHVCLFRHALALDERRVKFLPEFVNGGAGPNSEERDTGPSDRMPHTKEVWFTGTHSDIGGGSIENKSLNQNSPAFRWMTAEASKAGLLLTPFALNWDDYRRGKDVNESLTWIWRLLEILPIKRLTYQDKHQTTRVPHLGHRRKILPGQLVHRSVYGSDRLHMEYKNELGDWNGRDPNQVEPDKFDQVTRHIEDAIDLLGNMDSSRDRTDHFAHLKRTSDMFGSVEAMQAFVNLSQTLFHPVDLNNQSVRRRILATIQVLQELASGLFHRQHLTRQPPVIRELLCNKVFHQTSAFKEESIESLVKGFLNAFGTAEIFSIRRGGPITAFAFSPDSTRIACGTSSGDIFLREVRTGAGVEPTWNMMDETSNDPISCLAFSPDGKSIASGSSDAKIRIWDSETGKRINDWYNPAGANILSVSFAWDGQLVATSDSDVYVFEPAFSHHHVYDEKFPEEPSDTLQSHEHDVLLAAFSPKIETAIRPNGKNSLSGILVPSRGPIDAALGNLYTANAHGDKSERGLPHAKSMSQSSTIGVNVKQSSLAAASLNDATSYASITGPTRNEPPSTALPNSNVSISEPTYQEPSTGRALNGGGATSYASIPQPGPSSDEPRDAGLPNDNVSLTSNETPTMKQQGWMEWLGVITSKLSVVPSSPPTCTPESSVPSPSTLSRPTQYIVSGSRDKTFCVWQPEVIGGSWKSPPQNDEIRAVAFSPNGSKFFIGSRDGSVSRWDNKSQVKEYLWLASASKGDPSLFPGGMRIPVNSLAIAPRRTYIACGLEDGRVTLWDISTKGTAKFRLQVEHSSSVMSVSFSPDEKRFAACTREGIVFVWDIDGPDGQCILEQLTQNDLWHP